VQYHRVDASGALVQSDVIDVQGPAVMHDFIVTKRYAVFFDTPLQFAPPGGGGLPFTWRQDLPTRIGLLPLGRPGAKARWIEIAPVFLAHFLNAYDEGGAVVIRGVARDVGYALATAAPNRGEISMMEWRVDPDAGRVTATKVSDRRADFPRLDERRAGRAHRYGYAMEIPDTDDWSERGNLFKYDVATGAVAEHDFGKGVKASEPIFVPAAPQAGEDEGWVLSYVHDQTNESGYVAVIDAQKFGAPPTAIIRLPQRVPYGAHGSWIPAADL
jgi:carotenoid cleavage dioxygenase